MKGTYDPVTRGRWVERDVFHIHARGPRDVDPRDAWRELDPVNSATPDVRALDAWYGYRVCPSRTYLEEPFKGRTRGIGGRKLKSPERVTKGETPRKPRKG